MIFIVVPLLASSDAAFQGLIDNTFGNLAEVLTKTVLGLVFAPFLISYCFGLKKCKPKQQYDSRFQGIDNVYIVSFLSVLSVCYFAYLISQLAYFFSAFSGLLPEGYSFTVAEYARRGFFELVVITIINFVIIFTAMLLSKKKNGNICAASKVLCTFISVFTLIITSTAIAKMLLYIKSFGMTVLRITTSAFMIFLAVAFIALILRFFSGKVKVLRIALISAAVTLIILGVGNVNSFVADYNYNAYKNGLLPNIDLETIYRLDDEGIPYLIKLSEDDNSETAGEAKYYLYDSILYKYYETETVSSYTEAEGSEELSHEFTTTVNGKRCVGFEYMTLAKIKAYSMLDEYIEAHPDFLKEVHDYGFSY